jgi:hypothetical protein
MTRCEEVFRKSRRDVVERRSNNTMQRTVRCAPPLMLSVSLWRLNMDQERDYEIEKNDLLGWIEQFLDPGVRDLLSIT